MSVYFQTLVVAGYKFDYDALGDQLTEGKYKSVFDSDLHSEYDYRDKSVGEIVMVADGNSGEYVYFGKLCGKSNSTRDGEQNIGHVSVSRDVLENLNEVKEVLEGNGIEVKKPKVHTFTHV